MNEKIAVIRLRGSIKVNRDMKDTMELLGLKHVNSLAVLPAKKETMGMIKKVENFVTWGELSEELDVNSRGLKPAKGGLKSIKLKYPKGDLGYRGNAINDLIKRMI